MHPKKVEDVVRNRDCGLITNKMRGSSSLLEWSSILLLSACQTDQRRNLREVEGVEANWGIAQSADAGSSIGCKCAKTRRRISPGP